MSQKHPKRILIKRQGALGDVLCAEPILRALRRNDPACELYVQTHCAEILRSMPALPARIGKHVEAFYGKFISFDRIINLDLSYERKPLKYLVDAYAETAAVSLDRDTRENIPIFDAKLSWTGEGSKLIAVNSDGSVNNRVWNLERWKRVIATIKRSGHRIVEVGMNNYLGIGENYIGRLTFHQTAELIGKAELFMGFDGALMHVAQSIGTPVLIIFGCTCPNYRIHDWSRARVVWLDQKNLSCAGCLHLRPAPRLDAVCDREMAYCMENITEEMVLDAFYSGQNGKITEPLQPNGHYSFVQDADKILYQCHAHTRPHALSGSITQRIPLRRPGQKVSSIQLLLGTYGRTLDAALRIELLNASDEPLYSCQHDLARVSDNSMPRIVLKQPVVAQGPMVKLRLSSMGQWPGLFKRIAVYLDETSSEYVEVDGKLMHAGIHMIVS